MRRNERKERTKERKEKKKEKEGSTSWNIVLLKNYGFLYPYPITKDDYMK